MIRHLVTLLLLTLATPASAWHLVELEELTFTGAKLGSPSRDPMAPQYTDKWEYRGTLSWRFNILGPLYWDNKAHLETAVSSPRTVGWWWMAGLRITPQLDLFWEHHSRHILDQPNPSEYQYESRTSRNFPVEDSYGVALRIWEAPRGRSIFK